MKIYHSKEKVVKLYSKEEYRKEQEEFKELKNEIKSLRLRNLNLSKDLSQSCISEIENLQKINALENENYKLKQGAKQCS
ncbi:hypothetical protein [Campylobacter molothri]|uniref:Uncharacterized protein n=1 Tax=Campylobacter molothri TaxID=1032242 RepID=A0ACC5W2C8_9BACT|nr:hypothetical protein [Campylobacter sp. RM10534]MBZ7952993.1 hypothetical protein [Campylobacter sp. RM9939]MBZ7974615.1 hypothetical protein [Campylobacter sp. RM9754]